MGGWTLRSVGALGEGLPSGNPGINDVIVTRCPEFSESKIFVGYCCSYHVLSLEYWAFSVAYTGERKEGGYEGRAVSDTLGALEFLTLIVVVHLMMSMSQSQLFHVCQPVWVKMLAPF